MTPKPALDDLAAADPRIAEIIANRHLWLSFEVEKYEYLLTRLAEATARELEARERLEVAVGLWERTSAHHERSAIFTDLVAELRALAATKTPRPEPC